MKWLYSKWWKVLCVILLFYSIIGNFFVPLGSGISKVSPTRFSFDSTYIFKINCYNAHFLNNAAGKPQFWLKSGGHFFCPDTIKVINNSQAEASFFINSVYRDSINNAVFDLVANDDIDGTFALRENVVIESPKKLTGEDSLKAATVEKLVDSVATALQNDNKEHFADGQLRYVTNRKQRLSECAVEVKHNKAQIVIFPYREILYETIRNTFFHVPMWFTMTAMVLFSLFFSIRYLSTGKIEHDIFAHQAIIVGLVFGCCGLLTGSVWARYTWGQFWVNDPKLNGAAIGMVIYFAYLILRGSLNDEIKRARISAVYNVFALIVFLLFIFIMPRLTDSLHPGNGGNPAFSKYDLDSTLRMFFYPAVIGWVLLSFWLLSILIRIQLIHKNREI